MDSHGRSAHDRLIAETEVFTGDCDEDPNAEICVMKDSNREGQLEDAGSGTEVLLFLQAIEFLEEYISIYDLLRLSEVNRGAMRYVDRNAEFMSLVARKAPLYVDWQDLPLCPNTQEKILLGRSMYARLLRILDLSKKSKSYVYLLPTYHKFHWSTGIVYEVFKSLDRLLLDEKTALNLFMHGLQNLIVTNLCASLKKDFHEMKCYYGLHALVLLYRPGVLTPQLRRIVKSIDIVHHDIDSLIYWYLERSAVHSERITSTALMLLTNVTHFPCVVARLLRSGVMKWLLDMCKRDTSDKTTTPTRHAIDCLNNILCVRYSQLTAQAFLDLIAQTAIPETLTPNFVAIMTSFLNRITDDYMDSVVNHEGATLLIRYIGMHPTRGDFFGDGETLSRFEALLRHLGLTWLG